MITKASKANEAFYSKLSSTNVTKHEKSIEERERTKRIGLQDILNSLADGITLVDLDGKVTDCNKGSVKLLGLKREEIIGKNVYDIVIDEDKQRAMDGAAQVLRTGRVVNQVRVKRKNKTYFWAEISVTALYDQNGRPVAFLGVTRDITERKKIEAALKKSEELYRSLFDKSEDGFILLEPLFDADGNAFDFLFLKVNRAFERQIARKKTIISGRKAKEVAPTLEQEWISIIDQVAKTGRSVHKEQFNPHNSKWYDAYFFAFLSKQVGILFRDVTQRKRIQDALLIEKERYMSLANSLPEIVFEADIYGKLTFANQRAFEITGYNKEDFDNELDVFSLIAPQDRSRALEDFKKTLKNQPTEYYEYLIIKKDGSTFPAYIVINSINDKGYPTGIRGLVIDISEQKKMEKKLQNSQRLATIGQTAGMVGHDIRNPLQAIVSDTFLLRLDIETIPQCSAKEPLIESLNRIEKNVSYINKIVQDLQDYAKSISPIKKEIFIDEILDDVLTKKIVPENIEIYRKVELPVKKIISDPDLLKRILSNLVNNAVEAMPNGGTLRVIASKDDGEFVEITIEDSGIGIPEEVKHNLFTPMVTTKAKGQGFGLAVVKRLISSQGGSIDFKSEIGKGTKFIIKLPNKV